MLAYDGGIPSLSATATIDVLVNRNLFDPVFNPINYNVTIYETQALGVPFIKVNATDADTRVRHLVWPWGELSDPSFEKLGAYCFAIYLFSAWLWIICPVKSKQIFVSLQFIAQDTPTRENWSLEWIYMYVKNECLFTMFMGNEYEW